MFKFCRVVLVSSADFFVIKKTMRIMRANYSNVGFKQKKDLCKNI